MADEIFLADRLCSKVVHLMHTTSVMLIHDYILVTPSAHATKGSLQLMDLDSVSFNKDLIDLCIQSVALPHTLPQSVALPQVGRNT